MKTIIKTSRSRKSHLASFSMSKLPRLGKGVVVRAHITKASAAQVVAQVSAQAVTSEITGAANKSYKLVQMPRSKAEKLARRKDGGVFILGASTLPPNKFLRKIEKITPLSNVVGIDKFFPTVGTPVVSVRGTSSHPLAVSKIRTSRGGGAVIVGPSFGGAVFDRDGGGGGGSYRRARYVNTSARRSKAKVSDPEMVVLVVTVPKEDVPTVQQCVDGLGSKGALCTIYVPLANTTTESNTPETPTQFLPHENNYTEVVEWLAAEKAAGRDWYKDNNNNRSAMCKAISDIIGWTVDQNSLRKAQHRLQK